jgi:hypothetical protein
MPKNAPTDAWKSGPRKGQPRNNWLVEVTKRDLTTGKPIYLPDGSFKKVKVKMADGTFCDGQPQPLYYPDDHPHAGTFKGMARILEERGYTNTRQLKVECPNFKCAPGATDCCWCWILFNEPDFVAVLSLLEESFSSRGFRVLFLPKFHCELNFIEQV